MYVKLCFHFDKQVSCNKTLTHKNLNILRCFIDVCVVKMGSIAIRIERRHNLGNNVLKLLANVENMFLIALVQTRVRN